MTVWAASFFVSFLAAVILMEVRRGDADDELRSPGKGPSTLLTFVRPRPACQLSPATWPKAGGEGSRTPAWVAFICHS